MHEGAWRQRRPLLPVPREVDAAVTERARTPLTYYGGKQRMAPQIVEIMPPHRVYLEPFCGGAAVLFRKPPAERETINDLDGAVTTFWRVVRDQPEELARLLELTPYGRDEFVACRDSLDEEGVGDLELARRLLVTIDQSYSRTGDTWSPPSLRSDRRGRWQAGTWQNKPPIIVAAAERLAGVSIENTDAIPMLARWDVPECLIYCDPPYTGSHRLNNENRRGYRFDNHPELWAELVDALLDLQDAHAILSGYPCEEAERLERAGWTRLERPQRRMSRVSRGQNGGQAPETLWLNYAPELVAEGDEEGETLQGALL
jgi:DNA adenine methylase